MNSEKLAENYVITMRIPCTLVHDKYSFIENVSM